MNTSSVISKYQAKESAKAFKVSMTGTVIPLATTSDQVTCPER